MATIDSSCILFRNYKSDDILMSSCSKNITTDHTVLIVGHGTYVDSNDYNTNYFIVRNSWGTDWGNKGYMKISFDEKTQDDGILGIQQDPKYFEVIPQTKSAQILEI